MSLATRSLRNGAEGSGGPLGTSGEGMGGDATAHGPFVVAEVKAEVAEEQALEDKEGAETDDDGLCWFC